MESFGAETGKAAHDLKLFGQSVVITESSSSCRDLVHCRLEQDVANLRLVTEAANLPDECGGGFVYAVFQTSGRHGCSPRLIRMRFSWRRFIYQIRARSS